jgi:hypothetical protein
MDITINRAMIAGRCRGSRDGSARSLAESIEGLLNSRVKGILDERKLIPGAGLGYLVHGLTGLPDLHE